MSKSVKSAEELRKEIYAALKNDKRADIWVIPYRVADIIVEWHMEQVAKAEREARIDAAVMGAKFGNAAFRQYNIADPREPINLDVVLCSGIEQAERWAKNND